MKLAIFAFCILALSPLISALRQKGENCDEIGNKCDKYLKCNEKTKQCECSMNCSVVRCNMYPNCTSEQQVLPIDNSKCRCCPVCGEKKNNFLKWKYPSIKYDV
uniref:VWFC domain-containing protein n=1 Tax=Strigamia maritima TaxID=126957 RepID=T1IZE6_STRMM